MKISQPDHSDKPAVDPYAHHQPQTIHEPRTLWANWDLSEMTAASAPSRNGHSREPVETSSGVEPGSEADSTAGGEWARNPFPEPRTFPSRWDLSG